MLTNAAHNCVDASIAIEISERRATVSAKLLEVLSGRRAYIQKAKIAQVRQHLVRLPGLAAGEQLGVVVDCTAGGEQILMTVVIEVENSVAPTGGSQRLAPQPAG